MRLSARCVSPSSASLYDLRADVTSLAARDVEAPPHRASARHRHLREQRDADAPAEGPLPLAPHRPEPAEEAGSQGECVEKLFPDPLFLAQVADIPRLLPDDLQAALIRFQQQQPAFEEGISKQIQSACRLYEEARQTHVQEIDELQKTIATALQRIEPDFEWKYFTSRTENSLIDPETPLRSIEAIQFPGQNHASTSPLKEGYLERKKRFSKKYTEAYYVLTPSGYLHERKSS